MLNDINNILKFANTVKYINYIKIAVTVGMIGYVVLKIVGIYSKDIVKLIK